jgi:antitoxin (DNA-binding transcriptional repressor) of toxin-antitoxin stability system
MFHMKTANVREVRLNFSRLLSWIDEGEEVEITRRNEVVAWLVPALKKKARNKVPPDFRARLAKRDPGGGLKGTTYAELLAEERTRY